MAKQKEGPKAREIDEYDHKGQTRLNNPPVGLVTPETDKLNGGTQYDYDPHIDPQLQWAGKSAHTSFTVPRVSLHVHERIDPATVIRALRQAKSSGRQLSLFEFSGENPPLREAIEFYKHSHNWSNRLIAGDSLLVMNSLLEKEGMTGKVQMVFLDPPYGIRYGSNFQPFVNRREVKDGKDQDLTQEPETIRAFRDTWELGIHSYLSYLRDRLLLAHGLLSESGSVFVQISDENLHRVRNLLDEVFGAENFVSIICFRKTGLQSSQLLSTSGDYLVWYSKDKSKVKYHPLYTEKSGGLSGTGQYSWIESPDGKQLRPMSDSELEAPEGIPAEWRILRHSSLLSQGYRENTSVPFEFRGHTFDPGSNQNWKTTLEGLKRLQAADRLMVVGKTLEYKRYLEDFPVSPLDNFWTDTATSGFGEKKAYVVQTNPKVISRCVLMTTDPGDLVLDPTCGSGTTAVVAERWGRRWITCDTSRVAIAIAKQRLISAVYEYYQLAHSNEGVDSGFNYRTVPHVTLKAIANNHSIQAGLPRGEIVKLIARSSEQEVLVDQPLVDPSRARVTGPFTVEAVPSPTTVQISPSDPPSAGDLSLARSGETLRQGEWRDELLKTGIRGKSGQKIAFSRLEPLPALRWLHADGETTENKGERTVVSFGPEHAPLEPRHVALAIEEAQTLVPKPKTVVFAAFQFDPEASKDIDETNWPGVVLLKVLMNADLLTADLKKQRASNESFWLIGQPDVKVESIAGGKDKGKYRVEVRGFDYYNTRDGTIESGTPERIAMWLLDPDYDGRSLYPRQIFFPLAGDKEGWSRLARSLKSELDENLVEAFRGVISLPFSTGENRRIAVKIIDDRGIESLKVIEVE
jgi:adenine-specific DNA-methyltransferase